jgi:hypothetical protein
MLLASKPVTLSQSVSATESGALFNHICERNPIMTVDILTTLAKPMLLALTATISLANLQTFLCIRSQQALAQSVQV